MSVKVLRTQMANTIAHWFDEAVSVSTHGGSFGLDDLNRVSARAPAVVVACAGIPKTSREAGTVIGHAAFVAIAIAQDSIKEKRDEAALALMEKLLAGIPLQAWSGLAHKVPEDVSAANQYSVALDKKGISMWTVSWRQQVELVFAEIDTDALTKVNAKIDSTAVSTPTVPDTEDTITLTGAT